MINLNQILIGLVLLVIGILMVRYTLWFRNFSGPVGFLERYTGSGSTYGVYKIGGILLALLGIMMVTGLGAPFLQLLLSPFTDLLRGLQN